MTYIHGAPSIQYPEQPIRRLDLVQVENDGTQINTTVSGNSAVHAPLEAEASAAQAPDFFRRSGYEPS